jgi:hypothetical protein
MYASIGASTGAFALAAALPSGSALVDAARLCLAGAGALFVLYALVLLAVALRSAASS